MRRILRIHHLRQQELRECFTFGEDRTLLNWRPEHLHVLGSTDSDFVMRIFRTRMDRIHHNEDMLKLRPNSFGREWKSAGFLEDNCDYVVADVTFSQQLLSIIGRKW